MRTIIAGSRGIDDMDVVRAVCSEAEGYFANRNAFITEVVGGGARGVDYLGERWAREKGFPVKVFPADWNRHGKSAGYIRNIDMAKYAEALIAIWDNESRGTSHMIEEAREHGLKVFVKIIQ